MAQDQKVIEESKAQDLIKKIKAQNLIKEIRTFEAELGYRPATIEKFPDNSIRVTFDATVLYETKDEKLSYETNGEKLSNVRRFLKDLKDDWNRLNDRDTSFDGEAYTQDLRTALSLSKHERKGTLAVVGTVEKRHVKAPIPYFDIPLPFFKRAGTKVRDRADLATQPVKITLQFSNDCDEKQSIKDIIMAATFSHSHTPDLQLPSAAKRISWNPVKWLLHGVAYLIPRSIAQYINKILPNIFLKASRPRNWGAGFAQIKLKMPFINSGLLATVGSIPTAGLVSVVTRYDQQCNKPTIIEQFKENFGISTPKSDTNRAVLSSRSSFWSQTTTTVFNTGKTQAEVNKVIEAAVTPTGQQPRP